MENCIKAIKASKTHLLSPRGYTKMLINLINQNGSSLKVSRWMKNVSINELSIQLEPFESSLYSGISRSLECQILMVLLVTLLFKGFFGG